MKDNLKSVFFVLLLCAFFIRPQPCLSSPHNSESLSRIAVAAVGDSVNSEISMKAGRAPYYLFFDKNGIFLKSMKNPYQGQGSGTSSRVVDLFIKESVQTVIAGQFGDKMKKMLELNKIKYHEQTGIAIEMVGKIVNIIQSKDE